MKPIFISKQDLLEARISDVYLKIFKIGLLITVIIQAIGFYLDANYIFDGDGLFPHSLVKTYFENPLLLRIDLYIRPILLSMIFFAMLGLHKKIQNFCFFILFLFEWHITRRAFLFSNAGDTALLFFTFMAAFMPPASFGTIKKIRLLDLFPLYALCSIIYGMNFFMKVSSSWGEGRGLYDSLAHKEILWKFISVSDNSLLILTLNYLAIAIIFLLTFTPFLSLRRPHLRNFLAFAGIAYHGFANVIFHLSWLSLPFILLQITVILPSGVTFIKYSNRRRQLPRKTVISFAFILLSFFGIRNGSELLILKKNIFPVGHNWYMFAPPPPGTLTWSAKILTRHEEVVWDQQSLSQKTHFFIFQHEYKYFYNLRRAELFPFLEIYSKYLCLAAHDQYKDVLNLQLSLTTKYFATKEERTVIYPPFNCSF